MKKREYQAPFKSIEEIVSQLVRGDVNALDLMYRRYYQRLIHYGIQLVGNEQLPDIEDVVQELFMWIAKNYDQLGKVNDFEAYLFQSTRRNIFNKVKQNRESEAKRQRFIRLKTSPQDEAKDSHEEELIRRESAADLSNKLTQELDKLPTHLKEVLYLRYYQDRSYKQIAQILSISNQVARNFASRGIKRLKKHIKDASRLLLL